MQLHLGLGPGPPGPRPPPDGHQPVARLGGASHGHPEGGENSVGVDRRFFPEIGQVLNAQQAIGVWAATDELSAPVNWRIHLSSSWLNNRLRRRRAAIPEHLGAETFGDTATEAALETSAGWGLPVRPVVLDAWDMNVAATIRRFRAAGVPFLARVNSALRLTVTDPALLGRGTEVQPAGQVMTAARDRLRPVMWRDHDEDATVRTSLATAVRVQLPYPVRREAATATWRCWASARTGGAGPPNCGSPT
ncbi:transposase [Streptomyces sp. M19]